MNSTKLGTMKRILYLILLIAFSAEWTDAQQMPCARTTNFGKAKICLPKIDGYQETYTHKAVKQLANATEASANEVLGFYLNNATDAKKDSLGLFSFDDYFKIYGTTQIENVKADVNMLKQMQELLSGNFVSKNWDQVKTEIEKKGLDIEIGVPVVVKSYNATDNSFSYVMITNYNVPGGDTKTIAMTMNCILMKERLVWMAYYLNYQDELTISIIQKNTDAIIRALEKANP
jgi:hypothetical protein